MNAVLIRVFLVPLVSTVLITLRASALRGSQVDFAK